MNDVCDESSLADVQNKIAVRSILQNPITTAKPIILIGFYKQKTLSTGYYKVFNLKMRELDS